VRQALRLVSFDAHGTLIVPTPSVGDIYAEVGAAYGFERSPAELNGRFLSAFHATQSEWAVPYGGDDDDARAFWIRVVERTFDEPLPNEVAWECFDTFATAARWRVLPGVMESLAAVQARGIPMAVISNFDCRLPPLLAELKLGPFVTVVVSAALGAAKPAPAPMLSACAAVGCVPAEVLHIGDSATEDGGMCAASGAHWLAVEPGVGISLDVLLDKLG
jgi:putative hydrolase of the HAD superfamily